MIFETIRKNDTYNTIIKVLSFDYSGRVKVPAEDFNNSDNDDRKKLISIAFSKTLQKELGAKVNENFHCFNAEHEDKTPSMVFDKPTGHFHCYGCMENGKNYDVFNALTDIYGLANFKLAMEKAVMLFVDEPEKVKPYRPYPLEMYKSLRNPHYLPIEQDETAVEYLRLRGISEKTAKAYALRTWEYQYCHYLVFVNSNGSVVRRLFGVSEERINLGRSDEPSKWWNSQGKSGIFNEHATRISPDIHKEIIFVMESAFDCLSAIELGYRAVGLNSVNNLAKFVGNTKYPYLVFMFDNDLVGEGTRANTEREGFYTVKYNDEELPFISGYKDLNDCLKADREKTKQDLQKIVDMAKTHFNI